MSSTPVEKILFLTEGNEEPRDTPHDHYIGDKVFANRAYEQNNSKDFKIYHVTFHNGARTRLHHHDSEQVLIATEGIGYVSLIKKIGWNNDYYSKTEPPIVIEECKVTLVKGESILVPAGRIHWHGCKEGCPVFSHISILKSGKTEWL